MSTTTETFYAIKCDYTDCAELYDDGEYTYYNAPYACADNAGDDGWLIQYEDKDYCPAHTIKVDLDDEALDDDDHWGRRPLPETFEDRIRSSFARVAERCLRRFDRAIENLQRDQRTDQRHLYERTMSDIRKDHRKHIEADPEVQRLTLAVRELRARESELRDEAELLYGRAY